MPAGTFATWFADEYTPNAGGVYGTPNAVAPYSIAMTGPAAGVVSFPTQDFWPIDGLLGGNQGDANGHNRYVTILVLRRRSLSPSLPF